MIQLPTIDNDQNLALFCLLYGKITTYDSVQFRVQFSSEHFSLVRSVGSIVLSSVQSKTVELGEMLFREFRGIFPGRETKSEAYRNQFASVNL